MVLFKMQQSLAINSNDSFFKKYADILLGLGVVAILMLMIVPLPSYLLDFFLSLSIAISLTILMVSVYATKPLELSIFPTVLLMITMFRLALNLASTRLILLQGSEGSVAAGYVIQAFGQFVVGGSEVVGLIIFLILVIINFIVITKGAGRISEVSARFTLDAMPGKQLAIDADLNAGIISEKEAKERRHEIQSEGDFYGSMDGAIKKAIKTGTITVIIGVIFTSLNIGMLK
ncbi:hypothetical protein BVY03_01205, partial [bacterium K02(2017)]